MFDYQTRRSGQHAARFLDGWAGALMVDDYGGYKALFGQGVTELACFEPYLELQIRHMSDAIFTM